jgi:hypothetical protein
MQVNENPLPEEELKKKRRKRKQSNEGDSIVDDVADGCIFDGCYIVSWLPWDFDGGCLPDFDGGCIPDFDGGCFDIGDGCSSFDGCSMVFLFPLRLVVMFGLMLYGDWDFKHGRAKG